MPRKGKRRRIAKAIYEDGTGRAAMFTDSSGKRKEMRFPPKTDIKDIRADVAKEKAKHAGSGTTESARGTLNEAIDKWAKLERHLASWRERRAELRAWSALYGHLPLRRITDADVRKAVSLWATTDLKTVKHRRPASPKTIKNRLWTLKHLYRIILGPKAESPADHVDPPPRTRTLPHHVSPAKIVSVYQELLKREQQGILRDAKTRARFMVRAATGRRPSEIMRAKQEDVNLERRIWLVRDGKGGWSEGLYLNDDMLEAWTLFAESDAWGKFNTGSMAKALRAAGWPEGIRPYALRHSIGIDLSEGGADLADVGGWLGHTSVQTTRSSYVPILKSPMQRLSQQLDGRLGWKRKSA